MSAIEASSGTYRSRVDGTIVLSVEIEPRHAAAALALFGMPGTPMALAALTLGYASKDGSEIDTSAERVQKTSESVHDKPKGGALARLAGMWCMDAEFYSFIRPVYDIAMGGDGKGCGDVTPDDFEGRVSEYCKHCILVLCDIQSRAELDHDPVAAEKFHRLVRGPYSRHLIARGIVA